MELDEYLYGKPGIVVLSDDYSLNAHLQRKLQKMNYSVLGFYFVDDAIEWMESQTELPKAFIIDSEINGVSWKEVLRKFYSNHIDIDSIVLIGPDQHVSTREIKQLGAFGVFIKDDTLFDLLPDKLDEIIRTIADEYQQPAIMYADDQSQTANTYADDNQISVPKINEQTTIAQKHSFAGITTDIYDKQVEQTKKELELLYKRERSLILSYIGKEIKDAIDEVITTVRTIENTYHTEKPKGFFGSIQKAISDLAMLMNNLLDYSKIESDNIEVVYHNFHIKAMVNDVVSQLKHHSEENNIKLQSNFHNNVPNYIYGDKLKIQQVLNNLIRYAIKKSKNANVELTVQTTAGQAGFLVFSIKTAGRSSENFDKQKVAGNSNSLTTENHDAGIGLKTAQGLVYVMGGELIIKKDTSSSFDAFFTIPVMESAVLEVSQELNQDYGKHRQNLRVLLAEDDVINQMYLAGFLRAQGWYVDTAYNGLAVLELFEQGKYDLIILDGQMPGMDGFEAARRIRSSEANDSRIPILAISGYAIPGDKQKFLDAGMNDYLPKPINEDELLSVISKLTRN